MAGSTTEKAAPGRNDCATLQRRFEIGPLFFMRLFVIGMSIIASWQVEMERQRVNGNTQNFNLQVRIISVNAATIRRQNIVCKPAFPLDRPLAARAGVATFPKGRPVRGEGERLLTGFEENVIYLILMTVSMALSVNEKLRT